MMKAWIILLIFMSVTSAKAQTLLKSAQHKSINSELLKGEWNANWISVSGNRSFHYGIFHFRKSWELDSIRSKFIIHVSADNRYKLYINGHLVSLGPARGDLYNWYYETVNLSPFLKYGKNTLAAVIWNYAEFKPLAQISSGKAEFIIQGNTEVEQIVNTNDSWKCLYNDAYSPFTKGQIIGYYVAGPGERIDMRKYPWGWESTLFDDSGWEYAKNGVCGAAKGTRDYSGRLLVPSPIPQMELSKQTNSFIIRSIIGDNFPPPKTCNKFPIIIPPHSSVNLLLDNKTLTTGYLSLLLDKGNNAKIIIGYAESLYDCSNESYQQLIKGNRNNFEGKKFYGYEDCLIADGGSDRLFTSLWWRTWRYISLSITTEDDELILKDIYNIFTAYPFKLESKFKAIGHEELNEMLDIGWRTARLCAHETYMDCPYYEQLQYFGDTRIQAMITMYNTSDTCMVKHAIEQGRHSITPEGITLSRYPSFSPQFIPSYSLSWIGMCYDYWMFRGDNKYIKSLLPFHRNILSWFEQWLNSDYSLRHIPYWFFADWAPGFPNGEPFRDTLGNSAFQDLQYLIALEEATKMEQCLGFPAIALHYQDIASKIRLNIRNKYWDPNKKLFSDTYSHKNYSQHTNILAILAGIVSGKEAESLMQKILSDHSLTPVTIYFRYYLHQAMDLANAGDSLLDNLFIWKEQMDLGLSTWAEMPEPTRSDCHAWGASLNIEFYRMILGIRSGEAGFKKIIISPSLGSLSRVSGCIPHPNGEISVSFYKNAKMLQAVISLPAHTSGVFIWDNQRYTLHEGEQTLKFKVLKSTKNCK